MQKLLFIPKENFLGLVLATIEKRFCHLHVREFYHVLRGVSLPRR